MTLSANRKDYPISMRLPEADVALIDRAASLRGHSRTDFVREAAVRAAEDVLLETALIHMTASDFDVFAAVLAGPPQPVRAMVELLKRPAPWDISTAQTLG